MHRQQLLAPILRGRNQHQNAAALIVEPDVEMDPIRPQVHVDLPAQIALPPGLIVLFPHLLQAHDVRRREPLRLRPQDRVQSLCKISRGDPLQVQARDQGLNAGYPSHERRQNLAGELLARAPIMDPWLANLHRPEPRR